MGRLPPKLSHLVSRKLTKVRRKKKYSRPRRPAAVGRVSRSQLKIKELVDKGNNHILPAKSRRVYKKMWESYESFCSSIPPKDSTPLIDRLLAYFTLMSASYAPSSLWCYQSALKKKFELEGKDLAVFKKSTSLLKALTKQHVAKQADVFTLEQVHQFFRSVLDQPDVVLACSLLLHGGMRRMELTALTWSDIVVVGSTLVVTIRQSKTDQAGKGHKFVVSAHEDIELCAVKAYNRYAALIRKQLGQPSGEDRLFHQFHFGKYTRQVYGCHYPARLAKRCAELNGMNPKKFTAHSWRRTGATLLADAGATPPQPNHFRSFLLFLSSFRNKNNPKQTHRSKKQRPTHHSPCPPLWSLGVSLTNLKRFGRWQSSSVAESYVAESAQVKVGLSETLNHGELPVRMESEYVQQSQKREESPMDQQFGLPEMDTMVELQRDLDGMQDHVFDLPMTPDFVCALQEGRNDWDPLVDVPVAAAGSMDVEEQGPTDEELMEVLLALREQALEKQGPAEQPHVPVSLPSPPPQKRNSTSTPITTRSATRRTTRSQHRAAAMAA